MLPTTRGLLSCGARRERPLSTERVFCIGRWPFRGCGIGGRKAIRRVVLTRLLAIRRGIGFKLQEVEWFATRDRSRSLWPRLAASAAKRR